MAQRLHVRTANGFFLQASAGGGAEVTGRGPSPRSDETFELVPVAGEWSEVADGAEVRLRSRRHLFVTATGPDGTLTASVGDPDVAETVFVVALAPGEPSVLGHFSRFALRAANGRFVCAAGGGGGAARATSLRLGEHETFEALLWPQAADWLHTTAIRTVDGVHFLHARQGGGADLDATSETAGEWETFDLQAMDRASRGFPDGARVTIRTESGHYLCGEGGGGGRVSAAGPWPQEWETFRLVVAGGRGFLHPGCVFGLEAANGQHVQAEHGGGGAVSATGCGADPTARFTATFMPRLAGVGHVAADGASLGPASERLSLATPETVVTLEAPAR